jgi:hypothetical protein
MVLLSDYAKSCGYAVDKEKTSRGCAVREIETAGDKVIVTVDADERGMNDQGRRIHFENQMDSPTKRSPMNRTPFSLGSIRSLSRSATHDSGGSCWRLP